MKYKQKTIRRSNKRSLFEEIKDYLDAFMKIYDVVEINIKYKNIDDLSFFGADNVKAMIKIKYKDD